MDLFHFSTLLQYSSFGQAICGTTVLVLYAIAVTLYCIFSRAESASVIPIGRHWLVRPNDYFQFSCTVFPFRP